MKRLFALLGLLILTAVCGLAEGIMVPEGVVRIESEAFADASANWAFIPESCAAIDSDAFPATLKQIYGYRGSAAQRYAENTGRAFSDAGIYDVTLTAPDLSLPNTRVSVRAVWQCAFKVKAVYSLWREGEQIATSENGVFTLGGQGNYDVRVKLSNEYCARSYLFKNALNVIQRAKTTAESFEVAVGGEIPVLSFKETRACTLYIKDRMIAQIVDGKLIGLKKGETTLSISVHEGNVTLTQNYPISVYMPVERIDCAIEPFAYPGQIVTLQPSVLPADAKYRDIVYSSLDPSVASIDRDGNLHYLSAGEAAITLCTRDAKLVLRTTCVPRPESLTLNILDTVIAQSGSAQIETSLTPADALSHFHWLSMEETIAVVDENGLVTGKEPGSTTIICEGSDVTASIDITVKTAPQRVRLSGDFTYLQPGQQRKLEIELMPENTQLDQIDWRSSDPSVAVVDESGNVTALAPGKCVITARARSGFSDSFTLHVAAYPSGIGIELGESRRYLEKGKSLQLEAKLYPASAQTNLLWSSSDEDTVKVDADGTVTGLNEGMAVVTALLSGDESVSASVIFNVLSDKRTLLMPLRRTAISGITANLKRIGDVKQSALTELASLYARGLMGEKELECRRGIVSNAFEMYAFPWMVTEELPYWNSDNSDNGVKDFQTGVVYYGLPYISGDYDFNRAYNVQKALSEQRYLPVDREVYYVFNREKLLADNYVGCDCSTFIGMSYFGCNAQTRSQRTGTMCYSPDYITLDREAELYPGDIIISGYRHVVMFLYYANDAHTQIVTIEQGGAEPTVNTISASVYSLSYYYDNGYIARRYKYF
ncbi:MAG: Ig-like domain-containing protein [Clostridia bacterium]|nr:Ig-like domain-containing protein [Clostridia bacterium]